MEYYYMTIYVTLKQEYAITELFRDNKWLFRKQDQEPDSNDPCSNRKSARNTEDRAMPLVSEDKSAFPEFHGARDDILTCTRSDDGGNILSDTHRLDKHSTDSGDGGNVLNVTNNPDAHRSHWTNSCTGTHHPTTHSADGENILTVTHMPGTILTGTCRTDPHNVDAKSDCHGSKTKAGNGKSKKNTRIKSTNSVLGTSSIEPTLKTPEPIHCMDCKYTFKLPRNYEKHKVESRCRKMCRFCDKVFLHDKQHQYKLHIQRHLDVRTYKCSVCERAFSGASALEVHSRQHSGDRPFVCEACGATFACMNSLHRHKREEHTVTNPNFQCQTCGGCFKNKRNLKHHIEFVHEKPSERHCQCSTCGKTFKNDKSLVAHTRIHKTTKDFHCDICSATFVRLKYLREHQRRRHTHNFTHFCTMCDKGFYDTSSLKRHARKHTGHKPHCCPLCPYRATVKASVKRHMKRHQTAATVT